MALQDIVKVKISLQTSGVSRAGFGIPMFIGSHRWFTERSRGYPSLTAAAVDLPVGSNELIAVTQAFSQDVPPSIVKVGRRTVDLSTFTPDAATASGQKYTIAVTGTDSVKVEASYTTTTGSETATVIASALVTSLGTIPGVTIVDLTGTFSVGPATVGDNYVLSGIALLGQVDVVTENSSGVLVEISKVDDDYYFVACNDKANSFVLNMGAAIETATKLYFVSIAEPDGLTAFTLPAAMADTLGRLSEMNFFRTSGWFHQDALTKFPEMAFISVAAPSTPGTKIWANNKVAGVPVSSDPDTGIPLTWTQKDNLSNRNANFLENVGGITITRLGKVAGNEWIDVIRNRDFLEARITEGLQNKMINAPVIPFTDSGITEIRSVVTSVLNRSVSTPTVPSILQDRDPYTTNFPRAAAVSFSDKQARTLNATFVAYLAGAIQVSVIDGTLTYDNMA